MSFMQKQITEKKKWLILETECGDEVIPYDLLRKNCTDLDMLQYCEGNKIFCRHLTTGYGARMHAPGYLDCTEWTVFDTPEQAETYLDDMYGEEE